MSSDRDDIRRDFGAAVNMTAGELEKWLASDKSQSVGITSGGQKKSSSGGPDGDVVVLELADRALQDGEPS